jgi:hypothetical protein
MGPGPEECPMTIEELADLIVARTANLRDHMDRKLGEMGAEFDGKRAAQGARFVDQMVMLEQHLREHFDLKLSALQTHIYGKLLSIESDMLDLRGDVNKLREALLAQARRFEEHR